METVSFSQIIRAVWTLCDGSDYDGETGPRTQDFRNIRTWASVRLRQVWTAAWWPDLMVTEKRFFRPIHNRGGLEDDDGNVMVDDDGKFLITSQVYDKGDEVYYPKTRKYYQSLIDDNTQSPIDADGDENSAYWAECARTYTGNDWLQSVAYDVGEKVRNIEDDRFYQCHTAHTSGVNFDYTKFGLLTEFNQYVPYEWIEGTPIGTVRSVVDADPRVTRLANPLTHRLSALGLQIASYASVAWVEFLKRCPELTGNAHSLTQAYEYLDQIYFEDSEGRGDFYVCRYPAAAGETPSTHPQYWAKVEIPRCFESFLVNAVLADALNSSGQQEKAKIEDKAAKEQLQTAIYLYAGQQQQWQQPIVSTR